MSLDPIRETLLELPLQAVPDDLAMKLRVIASHAHQRRARKQWWKQAWFERAALRLDLALRTFAVPAAGGLLSSVLLFTALADSLTIPRYLSKDVPLGVYTQVAVDELTPFSFDGADVMVEVTIDERGQVSDFSVPNGKVSEAQYLQVANLVLFSTFTPATAYGRPISGKILVALRHPPLVRI